MIKSGIFGSGNHSSDATVNGPMLEPGPNELAYLVLDVRGTGWTGVLKVAARAKGAGAGAGVSTYNGYLPLTKREDSSTVDAATGVTADGIYEVDCAGMEVRVEHTHTAGSVAVYGNWITF